MELTGRPAVCRIFALWCRRRAAARFFDPNREEKRMPVPKRRTSKARKGKRRSHHALVPVRTVVCKHCGHATLSHTVCGNCGWYRDRQVVEIEEEE